MTRSPSSWAPARAPFGDDWGSFAGWVAWLDDAYELSIPGCWALHTGLVHQLEGLWHAWRTVYEQPKAGGNPPTAGVVTWHTQYLYAFLDRWRDQKPPGAACRGRDKHIAYMPDRIGVEAGLDNAAAEPTASGAVRSDERPQFENLTRTLGAAAVIGVLHPRSDDQKEHHD